MAGSYPAIVLKCCGKMAIKDIQVRGESSNHPNKMQNQKMMIDMSWPGESGI